MVPIAAAVFLLSQVEPPTFERMEKASLAARRAIHTAHVVLSLAESAPNRGQEVRTCQWEIWADGGKIRGDRVCTPSPDGGLRVVHIRNCEKPDWGFEFVDRLGLAAQFGPITSESNIRLYAAVHPRHFGYIGSELIDTADPGFEGAFGVPAQGSTVVAAVRVGESICWKLTWVRGAGEGKVDFAAVVDPTRGYNLVSHECSAGPADNRQVQRTISELQLWGTTWYPKRIVFEKLLKGEVIQREVATISAASFNKKIPGDTFTRAGAKLPARTYIQVDSGRQKSGFWDDGKMTPPVPKPTMSVVPPTPVADPGERRWNPWLLGVCAVFALAAAFLVVTKLRARRASP